MTSLNLLRSLMVVCSTANLVPMNSQCRYCTPPATFQLQPRPPLDLLLFGVSADRQDVFHFDGWVLFIGFQHQSVCLWRRRTNLPSYGWVELFTFAEPCSELIPHVQHSAGDMFYSDMPPIGSCEQQGMRIDSSREMDPNAYKEASIPLKNHSNSIIHSPSSIATSPSLDLHLQSLIHHNASSPTSRCRFGLCIDCRRSSLSDHLQTIQQCDRRRQIHCPSGSTQTSRQEDCRSYCPRARLRQIRQDWSECTSESQRGRFQGCGDQWWNRCCQPWAVWSGVSRVCYCWWSDFEFGFWHWIFWPVCSPFFTFLTNRWFFTFFTNRW